MWNYEKRLQFPIHIKNPNPALAAMIISQYGGPDGESSASMRYLSKNYTYTRNVIWDKQFFNIAYNGFFDTLFAE